MTEDEAKTKVCCGPGHIGALAAWASPPHRKDNPIRCIGSACMAWRWSVDDPATYESAPGFCGLAGNP